MKEFYVYKIIDTDNQILYIGETTNLKNRFKVHTSTQGLFYKRSDIEMIVVKSFSSKEEAFNYQIKLQKKYGFKTDIDKLLDAASNGGHAKIESFKKIGKGKRPIKCFDYYSKKLVKVFPSIRNAEKVLNVDNIEKVLCGKYKKVGNYFFEYV